MSAFAWSTSETSRSSVPSPPLSAPSFPWTAAPTGATALATHSVIPHTSSTPSAFAWSMGNTSVPTEAASQPSIASSLAAPAAVPFSWTSSAPAQTSPALPSSVPPAQSALEALGFRLPTHAPPPHHAFVPLTSHTNPMASRSAPPAVTADRGNIMTVTVAPPTSSVSASSLTSPFSLLFGPSIGKPPAQGADSSGQRTTTLEEFMGLPAPRTGGVGVCWEYAKGRCYRTRCRYSHDAQEAKDWLERGVSPTRSPRSPPLGVPYGVCWDYYSLGHCNRRVCVYRHLTKAQADAQMLPPAVPRSPRPDSPVSMRSASSPIVGGERFRGPCFDYLRGQCRRLQCRFIHDLSSNDRGVSVRSSSPVSSVSSSIGWYDQPRQRRRPYETGHWVDSPRPNERVCYDFQSIGCRRGNQCRFSHVIARGSRSPTLGGAPQQDDGATARRMEWFGR